MKQEKMKNRRRLRGAFSGKKGKAAGLGAVAAPLVGLVIEDLKSPDSLIRDIWSRTRGKLLRGRVIEREAIDITDQVEVLDDEHDSKTEILTDIHNNGKE